MELTETITNALTSPPPPSFYAFMYRDAWHVSSAARWPTGEIASPKTSTWTFPEQRVERIIVERLKEVPQVRSVCAQLREDEITIWTLLKSYDRSAREKVYQKEIEICDILSIYDFDFRVSSLDLVSPEELIGGGSREIYNRT